jgi:hypothetical protein
VFCVLACSIDDSADAYKKIVFSVAGFVGYPEDWRALEGEWRKRLDREGLDYFRTYDCLNLDGEFQKKLVDVHGLTTARVIADALFRDLKSLIAKSDVFGFSLGVLMADYNLVLSERKGAVVLHKDPYLIAHHQLIGLVLDYVSGRGKGRNHEIVAFLYDEHSKAQMLQNSWVSFKNSNPNWAKHAATLAPQDDKTHIPIQVADLLAHKTTKVYEEQPRDSNAAQKRLKDWLGRHLSVAAYMDAPYIRRLVNGNYDRVKAFKERQAFQGKTQKQAQRKSKPNRNGSHGL